MNIPDLVTMLINLSHSFAQLIGFLKGLAYLVGIVFMLVGLHKMRTIAARHGGGAREHTFTPLLYVVMGAFLIFIPSITTIVANTAFGSANVIAYAPPKPPENVYDAMHLFIQFAGFIWFIRGCVLVAHGSQPGVKDGPKGLAFMCGGIVAINVHTTMRWINNILTTVIGYFGSN